MGSYQSALLLSPDNLTLRCLPLDSLAVEGIAVGVLLVPLVQDLDRVFEGQGLGLTLQHQHLLTDLLIFRLPSVELLSVIPLYISVDWE